MDQAFTKYDLSNRGFIAYRTLRDAYDSKKHPDVCNGRKADEEALNDFLEIFEIHHNTFNNFQKNDKVSKEEFFELYRTLSPSYEDDLTFVSMVRGVWGVKNETPDVSQLNSAGGREDAVNSRDRWVKANFNKGAPFGTTQTDASANWGSTAGNSFRPATGKDMNMKGAGAPTNQQLFVQQQQDAFSSTKSRDGGAELLERFRDKMRQRGARGILGLKRIFKIMDDDNSGYLDNNEFNKALKEYRV